MVDTGSGRLFIVFTLAEASAILRQKPSPARTNGLAKIRTALEHLSPALAAYTPWRDEADGVHADPPMASSPRGRA